LDFKRGRGVDAHSPGLYRMKAKWKENSEAPHCSKGPQPDKVHYGKKLSGEGRVGGEGKSVPSSGDTEGRGGFREIGKKKIPSSWECGFGMPGGKLKVARRGDAFQIAERERPEIATLVESVLHVSGKELPKSEFRV